MTNITTLRRMTFSRIEQEHLGVTEAVEKVLAEHEPDEEAKAELVREGLRHQVNKMLTQSREAGAEIPVERGQGGGSRSRSGRFQLRTHHTEAAERWYWLSKLYATADGREAPLYEFSMRDAVAQKAQCTKQVRAWEDRDGFWATVIATLEAHRQAKLVAHLPPEQKDKLDKLAGQVLGGVA